jgi:hypothetical protein
MSEGTPGSYRYRARGGHRSLHTEKGENVRPRAIENDAYAEPELQIVAEPGSRTEYREVRANPNPEMMAIPECT